MKYNLASLNLSEGVYKISVKAKNSKESSDFSNELTYEVKKETFTQVYLTRVGAQYSSNTLSKLENVDTSKVYSYLTSNDNYGYFEYVNGSWTATRSTGGNIFITEQSENSITFHTGAGTWEVYLNYVVLEGSRVATKEELSAYTLDGSAFADWQCFVENTLISTKNGDKSVQDITYNDDILVWNFDEGKLDYAKPIFIKQEQTSDAYWHVTDEDGKAVNLVGSDGKSHRLYNKRTHLFEYPQDIPECKCEEIHESVKYYNILTAYHFNCFANGILTSKRYSNMLYPITDEMTYDKTVKHINTCRREQFDFLTDEEFEKLRLSEMEYSDEMRDEVKRFFALKEQNKI